MPCLNQIKGGGGRIKTLKNIIFLLKQGTEINRDSKCHQDGTVSPTCSGTGLS